jgi:hypothetical protein
MYCLIRDNPGLCFIQIESENSPTELQLAVCLFRRNRMFRPSLDIQIEFLGKRARQAFKGLYENYRKPVKGLLSKSELQFETEASFENQNQDEDALAINKMLDLFFAEHLEWRNSFELTAVFHEDDQIKLIENTFIVASALYESCCGYLSKRKRFDEIISFYQAMKKQKAR